MKIKSKFVIILFALTIILLIEKSLAKESICKEGEVYNECASACEPNCTNQNPVCIDMCMEGKCQCKEGFVRNENNECIPKEKCFKQENTSYTPSLKCGEGEEERSCPVCEATCQNPVIHICPLFCTKIPKCLCKAGYARVEKGKCIPISECPKESTTILPTKPTHIYPQLCCNPFLPCRICPQGQHCVGNPGERRCVSNVCNLLCRIGFECKIINNKPTCIPKCNKGEELKECANPCEPKCGEPIRFCTEICLIKPSCQCLFGYSRDSNGICIPSNECPTDQPKYCNKNCGFVYVCKIIDGEPKCVPPDFLNKTTTEPY